MNEPWEAAAEKKAKNMTSKNEETGRMFDLPTSEVVIQDYHCSIQKVVLVQGRMWVTQNYLCFMSSVPPIKEKIAFVDIRSIQKARVLVFPSAIDIKTTTTEYRFGSYLRRDETYELLIHLWNHPAVFLHVPKASGLSANAVPPSNSTPSAFGGGGGSFVDDDEDGFVLNVPKKSSGAGSHNYKKPVTSNSRASGGQQQQQYVKVDTDTSREALQIALQTHEMGNATLQELSRQGEVIDNIENDVESIHNNLDKAERHLRGIESFGGHMRNKYGKQPTSSDFVSTPDRTIVVEEARPAEVDIEILIKELKNDMYTPSTMRLAADQFFCMEPGSQKPKKKLAWTYSEVEGVRLRARPFHCDIFFKSKKVDRFRFCSSYVQLVVNELSLKIEDLRVQFEPGIERFDYKSEKLQKAPRQRIKDEVKAGVVFQRKLEVSPEIANAPEEVREALLQQDQDIDQISNLVGEIGLMAQATGTEVDRQTEQLKKIEGRVDEANERLVRNNQRVDNML